MADGRIEGTCQRDFSRPSYPSHDEEGNRVDDHGVIEIDHDAVNEEHEGEVSDAHGDGEKEGRNPKTRGLNLI
jgi:hypothetical protein